MMGKYRQSCLSLPPGLDAHLRNVFMLLLLCLRSTAFCDYALGQLRQKPPVHGGSGEAARSSSVSELPSSDCASALPGEFKRQCPNRVRFLPTRRITRTGGVLREQCDLQRYCLSAAGLPGLLRGSVRNENCQEWWESDGRETRTSLEQRHTGSTSATLQT